MNTLMTLTNSDVSLQIETKASEVINTLRSGQTITALAHEWSFDDVLQSVFSIEAFEEVLSQVGSATSAEEHRLANASYIELLNQHEEKIAFLIASDLVRQQNIDQLLNVAI